MNLTITNYIFKTILKITFKLNIYKTNSRKVPRFCFKGILWVTNTRGIGAGDFLHGRLTDRRGWEASTAKFDSRPQNNVLNGRI